MTARPLSALRLTFESPLTRPLTADTINVNISSQTALLTYVRHHLKTGQGAAIATLNLDHAAKLQRDAAFAQAYRAHDAITADGFPIVLIARSLGAMIRKTTGSDAFEPLLHLAAQESAPVAFIGSQTHILNEAATRLRERIPGLSIAHCESPPFGFDPHAPETDALLDRLAASGAKICFLALGAPRQEIFAIRARARCPSLIFVSIGASIDFVTGAQKRAPRWMQKLCLEWLWRLLLNPRRLAARYALCLRVLPGLWARSLTSPSGLVIDFTHVHRPITGIERVSLDLFGAGPCATLDPLYIRATSPLSMVFAQWVTLPLLALCGQTILCPGFPPSLALTLLGKRRVIAYIHDLFLIARPQDLNRTAKYYMRPSFRLAVTRGRAFLVNSRTTETELRKYCRADALIKLCRPPVADLFGLRDLTPQPLAPDAPLHLIALGTVEPRKNFLYAAQIRAALESRLARPVELHILGRAGWGPDAARLAQEPGVTLHGYQPAKAARELLATADLFLSTSHEEGLGLPLLEVQHGGLAVVATDIPSAREALGDSGLLIPPGAPDRAAQLIDDFLRTPDWRARARQAALANVAAWNEAAAQDSAACRDWLAARENQGPSA